MLLFETSIFRKLCWWGPFSLPTFQKQTFKSIRPSLLLLLPRQYYFYCQYILLLTLATRLSTTAVHAFLFPEKKRVRRPWLFLPNTSRFNDVVWWHCVATMMSLPLDSISGDAKVPLQKAHMTYGNGHWGDPCSLIILKVKLATAGTQRYFHTCLPFSPITVKSRFRPIAAKKHTRRVYTYIPGTACQSWTPHESAQGAP